MYRKFLKNYVYITGKKVYESFICSLKFINFIFGRDRFYNNYLFSDIYKNKERITIVTCGEKKKLFRKIIDNFNNFSSKNTTSDSIIGKEHFYFFKDKVNEMDKKHVFIFLCVENFNNLFTSKLISFMDKKYRKKKILVFIGERKTKSRLFERCLHLDFPQKEKFESESLIEKKITRLIEKKEKKYMYEICRNYSPAYILSSLEKILKTMVINSEKKCAKFIEAIDMINYVFYKVFFKEKKKMLILLAEILILLNEK
ncbi:hypothetical protein VFPYRLAN_073 [Candidatus Vidania fulgoroideae]|nr:hypothetical protein VFPYRLAN_073 [Candidatus Vidania fulgoroideae]